MASAFGDCFHDRIDSDHHDQTDIEVRNLAGEAELSEGIAAERETDAAGSAEELGIDNELTHRFREGDGYQCEIRTLQDKAREEDHTGDQTCHQHGEN